MILTAIGASVFRYWKIAERRPISSRLSAAFSYPAVARAAGVLRLRGRTEYVGAELPSPRPGGAQLRSFALSFKPRRAKLATAAARGVRAYRGFWRAVDSFLMPPPICLQQVAVELEILQSIMRLEVKHLSGPVR